MDLICHLGFEAQSRLQLLGSQRDEILTKATALAVKRVRQRIRGTGIATARITEKNEAASRSGRAYSGAFSRIWPC